jgi:hypothetical protein
MCAETGEPEELTTSADCGHAGTQGSSIRRTAARGLGAPPAKVRVDYTARWGWSEVRRSLRGPAHLAVPRSLSCSSTLILSIVQALAQFPNQRLVLGICGIRFHSCDGHIERFFQPV